MTLALLITAVGGAWADETPLTTITPTGKDTYSETTAGVVTVTPSNMRRYNVDYGWLWSQSGSVTVEAKEGYTITKCVFKQNAKTPVTITTSPFAITFNERGDCVQNDDMDGVTSIEVYGAAPAAEPTIDVTTNAASEQDLFTEASFTMPAFDATADYELVRDLGYKVAFSGVPTRARLAKDGNGKFHFADGLTFQLLDNIDAANPKDITGAEGITFMVGEVEAVDFEGHIFYQLNKETLVPLADFLADAHLGNYAICAVASTGEYDGSFTSGTITLFQGYEVEVAAKEFITYYKDEPLYVEDEDAVLYTISSVSGDQAVLSDKSDAMPSNTPMLVYNKSNETKVILLIPCAEPDMDINVAPEFQGTLEEKNMPASTEGDDYYVCTGNAFVWVKSAGTIAANRCWLEIIAQSNGARANTRSIVSGGDTTNIDATTRDALEGDYYDLQGRKVEKPLRKGIYIKSGKKVIKH